MKKNTKTHDINTTNGIFNTTKRVVNTTNGIFKAKRKSARTRGPRVRPIIVRLIIEIF